MALQVDFSRLDAQDVLDLAIQVEDEAKENYEQLASWMETDGKQEVAKFFVKMAGLEQLHRDQLTAQRQELFGDTPPRHSDRAVWQVEQPDYDEIGRDLTVQKAFDLSIDAERRAGKYYAEALEYASDPQVIQLFESLRDAEHEHLRLLEQQKVRICGTPG